MDKEKAEREAGTATRSSELLYFTTIRRRFWFLDFGQYEFRMCISSRTCAKSRGGSSNSYTGAEKHRKPRCVAICDRAYQSASTSGSLGEEASLFCFTDILSFGKLCRHHARITGRWKARRRGPTIRYRPQTAIYDTFLARLQSHPRDNGAEDAGPSFSSHPFRRRRPPARGGRVFPEAHVGYA